MSVRGKSKVHNEMGFALMAVNIRKYTAINTENDTFAPDDKKMLVLISFMINTSIFVYLRLVLSQPHYYLFSFLRFSDGFSSLILITFHRRLVRRLKLIMSSSLIH